MLWGDDEDMIKDEDIVTKHRNAKLNGESFDWIEIDRQPHL